jgi:multidrug resistance efflux pump
MNSRRGSMAIILLVAFVAIACYLLYWWFGPRLQVSTEDAYVSGNLVTITAHTEGTPIALYTDNARLVEKGQLLAELDPTDYRLAYEKARSGLQLVVREVAKSADHPSRDHPLIAQARDALTEAYLNLQRCRIVAPVTGYIANRNIEVGTWVRPATPLMAIIPLDPLWVDANFKETQVGVIRIGQPATITTDLYGERVTYKSKVAGISPGTGRLFSLLPSQNASGNWIKVVQRIPVRIYLDKIQIKEPLLAGVSAYVTIDITDTSGDLLASKPLTTEVTRTDAYNIPLDEVQKTVDEILTQEGLKSSINQNE